MKDSIRDEIQKIFQKVFDDKTLEINNNTNANDIYGWDSLEQINLITAIMRKFNIKFEMNEIEGLKNVGNMIDLIEVKLK